MRKQNWSRHRGWKKRKVDWSKPYKPTAFDIERDPTLTEDRPPFDWRGYRDFKYRGQDKLDPDDVLYRDFREVRS
jgi:hypothetical protein